MSKHSASPDAGFFNDVGYMLHMIWQSCYPCIIVQYWTNLVQNQTIFCISDIPVKHYSE